MAKMLTEEQIEKIINKSPYTPSTTAQLWSEIYGSRLSEETKAANAAKEAEYKAALRKERALQYLADDKVEREVFGNNGSYLL